MPDFSGASEKQDSWVTAGTPDVVRGALEAALRARRARLTSASPDGPLEAVLGSRFSFRMLGFLSPPGLVPVRVTASVTAVDAGSQIDVGALSHEGRYLFRVDRLADGVNTRGFTNLLHGLREAAPPLA